jgi:hypothetical protein
MREISNFLYQLGEWLSQNWIVLAAAITLLTLGLIWIFRELLRWFLGFGSLMHELRELRQELTSLKKEIESTSTELPAVTPIRPLDPLSTFEADRAFRTPEL